MNVSKTWSIVSILCIIMMRGAYAFADNTFLGKVKYGTVWMLEDLKENISIRQELAHKLTPKTLYDFNYHEYLAGADLSIASYRVLVANVGWAKSVETVNTRGIATVGFTLEASRSKTVLTYLQKILPTANYGFLEKLSVGGFTGYDFDRDDWRYGGYIGLGFTGLDLK